jgi:hypothetical protein
MEILELVDGKPADNGQPHKIDFMNLRRLQPKEKLTSAQPKPGPEYPRGVDTLIRGLVDLLPKPNSNWPLADRAKWLRLAAGIFDLGYTASDDDKKINIVVVKSGDSHATV